MSAEEPFNPYKAPDNSTVPESDVPSGYFVRGNTLIVANGTALPPICLKTGRTLSPDEASLISVNLKWPKAWMFFLLFGPWCGWLGLISWGLMIAALFAQRKASIQYHLSEEGVRHRQRWFWRGIVLMLLTLGSFAIVLFVTWQLDFHGDFERILMPLFWLGIALVGATVYCHTRSRTFHVRKIEEDWITIKGLSVQVLIALRQSLEDG